MTDDFKLKKLFESGVLEASLRAVPDTQRTIVRELRSMATAKSDDRYYMLAHVTPWIRNIWHAAADIIEGEIDSDAEEPAGL